MRYHSHEHIRALAAAVRDGELNPEQREHLVALLHILGMAVTPAPRAQETHAFGELILAI